MAQRTGRLELRSLTSRANVQGVHRAEILGVVVTAWTEAARGSGGDVARYRASSGIVHVVATGGVAAAVTTVARDRVCLSVPTTVGRASTPPVLDMPATVSDDATAVYVAAALSQPRRAPLVVWQLRQNRRTPSSEPVSNPPPSVSEIRDALLRLDP